MYDYSRAFNLQPLINTDLTTFEYPLLEWSETAVEGAPGNTRIVISTAGDWTLLDATSAGEELQQLRRIVSAFNADTVAGWALLASRFFGRSITIAEASIAVQQQIIERSKRQLEVFATVAHPPA